MPAPRRALIVIDPQNEYVTGNLPIEYPDVNLSLANICRAMDAAKARSIPVVVVQNIAPQEAPIFARGSRGADLHESVSTRGRDYLVVKAMPSAFAGTELGAWLSSQAIDTVAIVGYMTHNCNASTAFEAMHAGLAVEYLSDATGALAYENSAGRASAEEIHRVFCVVLQSRFAAVATTDEWIAAVETGEPLPRGSIYASNQRGRGKR